jgi:hypothetical protein
METGGQSKHCEAVISNGRIGFLGFLKGPGRCNLTRPSKVLTIQLDLFTAINNDKCITRTMWSTTCLEHVLIEIISNISSNDIAP